MLPSAPVDRPVEASAVVTSALTSANDFAFDLLAKLDASGNLALSPASIAIVHGAGAVRGARGGSVGAVSGAGVSKLGAVA